MSRDRRWKFGHYCLHRRGFSLIELMVSIGIIALLIGILFPALGHAFESARSVRCRANLRTLVTGLQLYRDDHRGDIPWARVIPYTIDDPEPFLVLSSYLDVALPVGEVGEEVSRLDPFACPSDRQVAEMTGFSYSYNPGSFMQVAPESWGRQDMNRVLEIYTTHQQIGDGPVYPHGLPVFQDFFRYHIDRDQWSNYTSPNQTGFNLAFIDGSVRAGD